MMNMDSISGFSDGVKENDTIMDLHTEKFLGNKRVCCIQSSQRTGCKKNASSCM